MRRLLGAAILTAMSAFPAAQHLIEGAAQSPVRVVIYEDLQCPDCADFRVMLDEKLLPRYASMVRFEHRDFPLAKHAWARKAAIAARFFEENQAGPRPRVPQVFADEPARDHGRTISTIVSPNSPRTMEWIPRKP